MPKFKKVGEIEQKREKIVEHIEFEKKWMFVTAIKTYLIAAVFLVFSILFNLSVITIPTFGSDEFMGYFNVFFNASWIVGFFFFGLISLANFYELIGYVLDIKGIIILMIVSILQGFTNGWVILVSVIGVFLVLIYIFLIQGKIDGRLDYSEIAKRI